MRHDNSGFYVHRNMEVTKCRFKLRQNKAHLFKTCTTVKEMTILKSGTEEDIHTTGGDEEVQSLVVLTSMGHFAFFDNLNVDVVCAAYLLHCKATSRHKVTLP